MAITGNKGEWSEIYVFLRLLADGKLFAADEKTNRVENMFFQIIKIIREENVGSPFEYVVLDKYKKIQVFFNNQILEEIPAENFNAEAKKLYCEIKSYNGENATFSVESTESFIKKIHVEKIKCPSTEKADINIQLHDFNTGYKNVVGFSIKSELGSPPTLLNPGATTNFIYRIDRLDKHELEKINSINSNNKIKFRIESILEKGADLVFVGMENDTFKKNLEMIDSHMPSVVAQMLIGYYSKKTNSRCTKIVDYVSRIDPLSKSNVFYKYKIKQLLCAIALGMKPATLWDGKDEASGGYIIVRKDGDVLAYHIYNRDAFKEYLLNNTKLDSASSSRYGYGVLYEENGETRLKLNLQIRFVI